MQDSASASRPGDRPLRRVQPVAGGAR